MRNEVKIFINKLKYFLLVDEIKDVRSTQKHREKYSADLNYSDKMNKLENKNVLF